MSLWIIFKTRNFIDKFSENLISYILCSVNISANCTCDKEICTVQYRQTDRRQQCVQFSTDRQTADSNVYSSVPTDPPQTAMCTVQYRQTDRRQQCVQFSTDRQTADSNVTRRMVNPY